MNRHEKAQEFESKFNNAEINSCSIDELIEYLEAISDFSSAIVAKYAERSSHIQILNSLITVKTIKKLNYKNTFLTWVVIALAFFSLFATCAQIYFTVKENRNETTLNFTPLSSKEALKKELNHPPIPK